MLSSNIDMFSECNPTSMLNVARVAIPTAVTYYFTDVPSAIAVGAGSAAGVVAYPYEVETIFKDD